MVDSTPRLFVVVCMEYHKAVGLFADAREAVAVAKSMTSEGECKYVPVPITIEGAVFTPTPTDTSIPGHARGYL